MRLSTPPCPMEVSTNCHPGSFPSQKLVCACFCCVVVCFCLCWLIVFGFFGTVISEKGLARHRLRYTKHGDMEHPLCGPQCGAQRGPQGGPQCRAQCGWGR